MYLILSVQVYEIENDITRKTDKNLFLCRDGSSPSLPRPSHPPQWASDGLEPHLHVFLSTIFNKEHPPQWASDGLEPHLHVFLSTIFNKEHPPQWASDGLGFLCIHLVSSPHIKTSLCAAIYFGRPETASVEILYTMESSQTWSLPAIEKGGSSAWSPNQSSWTTCWNELKTKTED
jgi:hypothetical protein